MTPITLSSALVALRAQQQSLPGSTHVALIAGKLALVDRAPNLRNKEKRQQTKKKLIGLVREEAAELLTNRGRNKAEADALAEKAVRDCLVSPEGELMAVTIDSLAEAKARLLQEIDGTQPDLPIHVPPPARGPASSLTDASPAAQADLADRVGIADCRSAVQRIFNGAYAPKELRRVIRFLNQNPGCAHEVAAEPVLVFLDALADRRLDDTQALQVATVLAMIPPAQLPELKLTPDIRAAVLSAFQDHRTSPEAKSSLDCALDETRVDLAKIMGLTCSQITERFEALGTRAAPEQSSARDAATLAAPPRRDTQAALAAIKAYADQPAHLTTNEPTAGRKQMIASKFNLVLTPDQQTPCTSVDMELCVKLTAEHPVLAFEAALSIEDELYKVDAGISRAQGDPRLSYFNSAKALTLVPSDAWAGTYLPRAVVNQLMWWHSDNVSRTAKMQSMAESLKKTAMASNQRSETFNIKKTLLILLLNAVAFERFLESELAHVPELEDVDRSILVPLLQDAEQLDAESPVDEAEGKSMPQALRAGARPQPAHLIVQDEDFWPTEKPKQGTPPVREKRRTDHHDGSKAKWRKKSQRRRMALHDQSPQHRQAVEAVRALKRQREAAMRAALAP